MYIRINNKNCKHFSDESDNMKTTLLILGIFLAFTNACNQNTPSNTSDTKTFEKTEVSNNSDSIKNNIEPKEVISETPIEQTKSASTKVNNIEKKKKYFKLLSAISENWTAGIPSGGSGTEYYVKIKIITTEKIVFDTLWINNTAFETFISKESTSVSDKPIQYSKGDIITVRATELKNQNIKPATVIPPIKYNGAALIGYRINGKQEYFTVTEIKKQSSRNRP